MDTIEEMRKKLIDSAKRKVQQKYEQKDVHIIKSVNILEDLDPISNLLTEQLREWHSVHFPELNEILANESEEYLKLVCHIGQRENFSAKNVAQHVNNPERAANIMEAAKKSMGAAVSEKDMQEMKALALNCLNLRQEREYLSKYLEETMQNELPNFTEVAGPVIGAKILAKAGSKRKLAFLPASAIQMIGAEKALFMHFKKGVKGPKYGYLYQHPLVKAARQEDKGRLARTIASKLAIAAKMDYFGAKSGAAELRQGIEKRATELHGAKKKPEKPIVVPERAARTDFTERRGPGRFMQAAPRKEIARGEGKEGFGTGRGRRREDFGAGRRPFGRDGMDEGRMPFREEGRVEGHRRFRREGRDEGRRPFRGDSMREGFARRPFGRHSFRESTQTTGRPHRAGFVNRERPFRHREDGPARDEPASRERPVFGRGHFGRRKPFGERSSPRNFSGEGQGFRKKRSGGFKRKDEGSHGGYRKEGGKPKWKKFGAKGKKGKDKF